MTALEDGVFNVDWWDTHNGATTISTAPDGATDYGDWGVLSSATCVGSTCEPAMNTPFPSYYAISMLSKLGRPGDQMVNSATDQQLVSAHAVLQANGNLAVQLVNKDPNTPIRSACTTTDTSRAARRRPCTPTETRRPR